MINFHKSGVLALVYFYLIPTIACHKVVALLQTIGEFRGISSQVLFFLLWYFIHIYLYSIFDFICKITHSMGNPWYDTSDQILLKISATANWGWTLQTTNRYRLITQHWHLVYTYLLFTYLWMRTIQLKDISLWNIRKWDCCFVKFFNYFGPGVPCTGPKFWKTTSMYLFQVDGSCISHVWAFRDTFVKFIVSQHLVMWWCSFNWIFAS